MDEYYRILESLPPALRTPLAKLDAHYAPTFRRSVCGWGQPVQFTICGRLCPAAKFLPEQVCLPRWRPTPCGTAFCSSAAARSTPMRTS